MPEISFTGDARYIALLKLPNAVLEQLKAQPSPEMSVTFSDGSTSLQIGDCHHVCTSMATADGDCSIVEVPPTAGGTEPLVCLGDVDDRFHVAQTLGGAGSSVRKQIKERHHKAQADKEGSHRIAVEGQAGRSAPSRPVEKKQKVRNGAAVTAPTSREPTGQATLARKTPRSNGAGAAAGAGASSEGNYTASGSGSSRVDPELLAREWCVHLLALGPSTLQGLIKEMRAGSCDSTARDPKVVKKVLEQAACLKEHERYHLMPSLLGEARPEWAHYSQKQRSTLHALIAKRGESAPPESAPPGTANGKQGPDNGNDATSPADLGEDEAPVVRSKGEYDKMKKTFESKYRTYQQLDKDLASQTKFFEELNSQYQRANSEERPAIFERLSKEFENRKAGFRKQAHEYRKLHLELKGLKEAVNEFVSEYGRRD